MDKYEYKRPENEELVEVTVPSGNIFLFRKPSLFSMMFQLGKLPQMMANSSFEKWKLGDVGDMGLQDQAEMLKLTVHLTEQMMRLSVNPHLVDAPTTAPGEAYLGDIADVDVQFLLNWVASGGSTAAVAATFPRGQQSSPVASPNRKARRATAKQAGGVN